MSTVTEADRALAHSLAREIDLHYADSDAQAIAKAIATAREAGERAGAERENEECARIALERLNHWRDNCDDNIKAGCAPPQYNMGGRAEAATIMTRIVARRRP